MLHVWLRKSHTSKHVCCNVAWLYVQRPGGQQACNFPCNVELCQATLCYSLLVETFSPAKAIAELNRLVKMPSKIHISGHIIKVVL